MTELINEAIAWYNVPWTVLLGLVVFYWIMVSAGIFDVDAFNPEFDVDADVDVGGDVDADVDADLHVDADADADGHFQGKVGDLDLDADLHHDADIDGHGGFGMMVLRFLNFGQVPTMVIFSVFALCLWMISVIANAVLNPMGSIIVAAALLGGNLFVSAIVTKMVTTPLKPLMRMLNKDYDTHEPIVGRTCVVRSLIADAKGGQAEVERDGAPLLINVKVSEGAAPIKRGTKSLVVHYENEKDFFIIRDDSEKDNKEE